MTSGLLTLLVYLSSSQDLSSRFFDQQSVIQLLVIDLDDDSYDARVWTSKRLELYDLSALYWLYKGRYDFHDSFRYEISRTRFDPCRNHPIEPSLERRKRCKEILNKIKLKWQVRLEKVLNVKPIPTDPIKIAAPARVAAPD